MNLKRIRNQQKISQAKLAELSGVPRRTIENIEKVNNCKVDTAKKLARTLNVSLDELCSDPEE